MDERSIEREQPDSESLNPPPQISARSYRASAERAQARMLVLLRVTYMVILGTVALLPFVGSLTEQSATVSITDYWWVAAIMFLFGSFVMVLDALTPNKRLASVFGIYFGVVGGMVGALAIGALIDLIADSWELSEHYTAALMLGKLAVGISLCYLAVSLVLTTKDDFRLVIPYIEFAKQIRGVRPLLLDTSALIDGRIGNLCDSGFLEAPLVVPQFVINELQTLSDSADKLKRARGRRGLDMVAQLQANASVDITIDLAQPVAHSVDHMLIQVAADQKLRILTTDYNLNKVAQIQGVSVLNINDLSNSMRPQVIVGDEISLEIVKRGENQDQGVGYMPDGTMVVVEQAAECVGQFVGVIVTNALQTSAGRMIFGRLLDENTASDHSDDPSTEHLSKAATSQPKSSDRPSSRPGSTRSRNNPRR